MKGAVEDLTHPGGRGVSSVRTVAVIKYLVKAQFGYRTAWGRINWRAAEGGLPPRLVIGGQEVPWEKLGRMPMTLQGWQFRVEIRDRSEDM